MLTVHKVLSSHLLPRNVKIKTYKIIILPFVLCRCEIVSCTEGRAQTDGDWEQGACENTWACDSMSYIYLGGRWCDIIVPNERAPTENKG